MQALHNEGQWGSRLRQVDLNLLVALSVLCEERSVSRAAVRLGLTQPAMSHALRRLRETLGDPLLVRTAAGMELTPRAVELARPLRHQLAELDRLIHEAPRFEPATSSRTFRLAAPDLVDLLFLPLLLARLTERAPQLRLALGPTFEHIDERLGAGEIDLAIMPSLVGSDAPFGPRIPEGLVQTTLLREGFRVFVRSSHELTRHARMTRKRLLQFPHVLVSPTGRGGGPVDAVLEAEGLRRDIALRVSTFAAAVSAVRHSDLVLTAPAALARVEDVAQHLASFPVPLPLPEQRIHAVWHPRFTDDAAHRWFREQVAAVVQGEGTTAARD